MSGPSVAVIGSINTDFVLVVDHRPLPGETVADAVLEVHPGGKGANQAVAAARSGAQVALIGRIGDDPAGRVRLRELEDEHITTEHVSCSPDTPTGVAFITLTPDGENSIVVAPGANARLSPRDVERARPILASASVLVVQLEVPLETVERGVALAGRATRVVLNCAPYRPLPAALLQRVDVLVANTREAAALSGRRAVDSRNARDVARAIGRLGPSAVVITLGGDGAAVAAADFTEHLGAPKVDAIDTTGAGDAFVGALAARLAAGAALTDAVRFGVGAGAQTVTQRGASGRAPRDRRAE